MSIYLTDMEKSPACSHFLPDLSYLNYLLQWDVHATPIQRDATFRRQFNASQGYLKLDMIEDSWAEAMDIAAPYQERPEVMQLKVWILMKKEDWKQALNAAEDLCHKMPHMAVPYLDAAYCLHELKKTAAARKKLLSGPSALQHYPTYHYNLACYEASLGYVDSARHYLETAILMNPKYSEEARRDPDLKCLWG
jgi:hypothetical protein